LASVRSCGHPGVTVNSDTASMTAPLHANAFTG
jgi:hypothetical protein